MTGVGSVTNQVAWVKVPLSSGSTTTTAPLVPGAVVAGCLAVAIGYGVQAALRLARREPGSLRPLWRVPGQADRGGAGRAYV